MPGLGTATIPIPIAVSIAVIGGIVALLTHIATARQSGLMSTAVLTHARAKVIGTFTRASWETQAAEREGALQETATGMAGRASLLVQSYINAASNAIMVVVFLVSAFTVDRISTLVVVAVGVLLAGALRPIAQATHRAGTASSRAGADYAQHVSRFSSTSMEFRVFGVQLGAEKDLAATSAHASELTRGSRFFSQLGGGLFRDIAIIVLILCVAGIALFGGGGDAGGLFAVMTLVIRGLTSAQIVNTSTQSIRENAGNLTLLWDRVHAWTAGFQPDGTRSVGELGDIRLERVGYQYPPAPRAGSKDSISRSGAVRRSA